MSTAEKTKVAELPPSLRSRSLGWWERSSSQPASVRAPRDPRSRGPRRARGHRRSSDRCPHAPDAPRVDVAARQRPRGRARARAVAGGAGDWAGRSRDLAIVICLGGARSAIGAAAHAALQRPDALRAGSATPWLHITDRETRGARAAVDGCDDQRDLQARSVIDCAGSPRGPDRGREEAPHPGALRWPAKWRLVPRFLREPQLAFRTC
jgi:hypothetical protein